MEKDKKRQSRAFGPSAYNALCDANVSPNEILQILHQALYVRCMDDSERRSLLRAVRTNESWSLLTLEHPSLPDEIKTLEKGEWKHGK